MHNMNIKFFIFMSKTEKNPLNRNTFKNNHNFFDFYYFFFFSQKIQGSPPPGYGPESDYIKLMSACLFILYKTKQNKINKKITHSYKAAPLPTTSHPPNRTSHLSQRSGTCWVDNLISGFNVSLYSYFRG